MAGVKGKSGGPRKNAGGARPGAGRKPKSAPPPAPPKSANGRAKAKTKAASAVEVKLESQAHGGALKRSKDQPVQQDDQDMLTLLQNIALGRTTASAIQVKAASVAVQYTHAKKGDAGKKEERQKAAEKVGGRFAATPPPRPRMN
ncbi:hypothetical protein NB717_000048 [Xanthomonas sacchari]|nr:hypothetical protein [Xanthomonas sacchari]